MMIYELFLTGSPVSTLQPNMSTSFIADKLERGNGSYAIPSFSIGLLDKIGFYGAQVYVWTPHSSLGYIYIYIFFSCC